MSKLRGILLRGAVLMSGLAIYFVGGHLQAASPEIPPQCYRAPVTEGIPMVYARESLIDQPILVQRADPEWPKQASTSIDYYCASFSFQVNAAGKPVAIEVLYDSHPGIDGIQFGQMAQQALKQWRYQPGMVDKGEADFLGFTAVFFKGFGKAVTRHAALVADGQALLVEDDVAKSWRSYGKTVTQEQLEQLEMAAEQKVAPQTIAAKLASQPKKPRVKIVNSWVVADDGSVLIGDKVYALEEKTEEEQTIQE